MWNPPELFLQITVEQNFHQIENEEWADDKEGDEVGVGEVSSAAGRISSILAPHVAEHIRILLAGQHDLLPGLARGRSEEDQQSLRKRLEVVVPVDVRPLLRCDLAEHLKKKSFC